MDLTLEPLTPDAFRPYGGYFAALAPEGELLGAPPIEFFRDRLRGDFGRGCLGLSVCRVAPRPPVIDTLEFHSRTDEALLPLDGDVAIHVAAANAGEVPLEAVRVFHVPRGTLVLLLKGTWHHAPYALGGTPVHVLTLLPERTYANDCTCHALAEGQRLAFGA